MANTENDENDENLEIFNDTASSMIRSIHSPVTRQIIADLRRALTPYENIAASLDIVSKVPGFGNLGMFTQLMESQKRMLDAFRVHTQLFDSLQKSTSWQNSFGLKESYLKGIAGFDSTLNIEFAKSISAINLGWNLIDNGFASKISDPLQKSKLLTTFQNLSSAYIGITDLYGPEKENIFSLPEYMSLGVTKEYSVASQSYVVISDVAEDSEENELYTSIEAESFADVSGTVPSLLSKLNVSYGHLWLGALQALEGNNPEKIRHASTSLRELLTHLLHQLSPDDKIRAWNQDPSLYSNNQPTRAARMRYILRDLNIPQLNDFFEKDIKACIELMNALNAGTHSLEPRLNEKHLRVLVVRVGSFIQYLYTVIES